MDNFDGHRSSRAHTGRVTSAIGLITERVRERVRVDGVDLAGDEALAARLVRDEVQRYSEHALGGSHPLLADEAAVTRQVVATLTGFGPLQPYLDDPSVEELWINGPDRVFIAREGVSERVDLALTELRCANWSSGCCTPPVGAST